MGKMAEDETRGASLGGGGGLKIGGILAVRIGRRVCSSVRSRVLE